MVKVEGECVGYGAVSIRLLNNFLCFSIGAVTSSCGQENWHKLIFFIFSYAIHVYKCIFFRNKFKVFLSNVAI